MKNYRLTIAYDGTRYSGWERKKDRDTIQGKLENVLQRMCNQEVNVIGAGRTDAGVHAVAMIANVHLKTEFSVDKIKQYLNNYLPDDICVTEVSQVSDRFHARYNAKSKTYIYSCYIGNNKPIFDRKYIYTLDVKPDIEKMRQAAVYLMGEQDFASFCTDRSKKKSTVRHVDRIEITEQNDRLTFLFHGTGFLYNMVRIMVGTLLKVGAGELQPEDMQRILAARKRSEAGPTAPAQGLRLESIDY